MKKTTRMIAACCLTGSLSAGSLLATGAAFAETPGVPAATSVVSVQSGGNNNNAQSLLVLKEKQVNTVRKSEPFRVQLEENATTGYSWTYKISSASVKRISEKSEPIAAQADLVGAPVQKTWTFRADRPGTYTLTFVYARSWEANDSSAQTMTYTVKVKG